MKWGQEGTRKEDRIGSMRRVETKYKNGRKKRHTKVDIVELRSFMRSIPRAKIIGRTPYLSRSVEKNG